MPNTIKFSDNPNEETAFVETDDGQRNRAVLTAAVDGEIEFPANPNSTKVSVTVDGVKRKAIAVATIAGSGGGDQHNLGYYATQAALEEAHPTAEAGDYAIVGSTDTVWLWDEDTSAWIDSDQKGQVTSVNGQTGDVTLTIPDAVQYSTMPTASADNLGDIVQFTGTTDANYTNGYFYKCTGAGDPVVYSWTRVDVQPTPSGLPDQTGQSGKFLTTDGTDASWSNKPVINQGVSSEALMIAAIPFNSTVTGNATLLNTLMLGSSPYTVNGTVSIGGNYMYSQKPGDYSIGINRAVQSNYAIALGGGIGINSTGAIAITCEGNIPSNTPYAIQLGKGVNSDTNTFKVGNNNGNYEIMSADGTIPADRLTHAINKYSTMPTASASNEGWIVQFTGTTDSTYTHGHLYECVSDGADPATYSWTEVQLGGGGSSYTAGTGIDITSGVISVADPVLVNKATGTGSISLYQAFNAIKSVILDTDNVGQYNDTVSIGWNNQPSTGSVLIGYQASATSNATDVVAIGKWAGSNARYCNNGIFVGRSAGASGNGQGVIVIGAYAKAKGANAIQLGGNGTTTGPENPDANTFKVANANGNFELMNANGNLPADRLASTTGLADGNYRLRLVMASGVPTLEWVAE